MRAAEHGDVIATADALTARVLEGRAEVDRALALLDDAEAQAGLPLVDESERARLEALADGREDRAHHWHSILAAEDGRAVGYAGLLLPAAAGRMAQGDVAMSPGDRRDPRVLSVLLRGLELLGRRHGAGRVRAWLRHATDFDIRRAAAVGFSVDRRLGVLGRDLDDVEAVPAPPDVRIRAFRASDADDVVVVLGAAYAGTPDGGWTRADLDRRRTYGWYRDEDLLVAERDGRVVGLHWTKRRGEGVGEVYNLAVSPSAQGDGLGAVLLAAGLAHLRDVGCRRVLLWVDLSNERAVRLYAAQGFAVEWEDVAFGHHLAESGDA